MATKSREASRLPGTEARFLGVNSRRALHCCNSDGHRPFLATRGSTGTASTVALRDKDGHAEAATDKRIITNH